eukprot:TRINITY_DN21768_c0_g1_i12.p1 TRINITY_DN21768_c0_g1~~TRINITY_DN21768_c0_g1_i12.p1  ORF type:complete len:346 (+),score=72.42 TRINITY_DN21768_c0_g1_i12:729-1766(+)
MATLLLHGSAEIQPNFLMMAIKTIRHNSSLTKLLYEHVKQNQDANFLNDEKLFDGELPLVVAARNSLSEITWFLLEKGALPDLRDPNGRSAIATAITHGFKEIVETLLIHGADPNGGDGRLLRVACRTVSDDIPRLFIAFGANLDVTKDYVLSRREDSCVQEARKYRNSAWSTFLGCMGDDSKESAFASFKESILYERQVLSIIKSMVTIGNDWQFPEGDTSVPPPPAILISFFSWFAEVQDLEDSLLFDIIENDLDWYVLDDWRFRLPVDSESKIVPEKRIWGWAFDRTTYGSFKKKVLLLFKEALQTSLPMKTKKIINKDRKFSERMNWRLQSDLGFGSGLLF